MVCHSFAVFAVNISLVCAIYTMICAVFGSIVLLHTGVIMSHMLLCVLLLLLLVYTTTIMCTIITTDWPWRSTVDDSRPWYCALRGAKHMYLLHCFGHVHMYTE